MTKVELGKVGENLMLSEKAVEKSGNDITNKKGKVSALKLEMDKLMNLDKYDAKIRECMASKLWLDVYSEEDILKELQTQLDVEESVLNKAQKELLEAEGDEAASGNKEELRLKMEAINLEVEDVMLDIDQRNSIVKEKNLEVAAVSRDLKNITANRSEHNARLNNVKREISDLRARALENAADNERIILQKIDECDKFVEGGREEEQSFREQKNIVTQKMDELKKEGTYIYMYMIYVYVHIYIHTYICIYI
jgi:chromosome segregation ATPase